MVSILIVVIGVKRIENAPSSSLRTENGQVLVPAPRARQVLGKEFLFPLKDGKAKEITKIHYAIESAEFHNELILKGQRAKAVKGRVFLILNLKIKNDHTQGVRMSTRDYVRLSVNGKNELLAPDIHNDPVEVQAISTKYTRVGFPINETDTTLTLQVGEIEGKKEAIKLALK